MGYRLGVDLGTTFTAAVVHRPGAEPTVVPLGDRSAAMPSVLYLGADGAVLIGDAAERRALTDPDRVVRRFKRRIGDETPLLFGARDGEAFTAHAVAARMIALVADRVAEREGTAPDAIAVTVPAAWGPHKKDLLTAALTREGLLGATLVSEPAAAALAYAHAGRLAAGTTLAIYDFGGGTFDAALLQIGPDGGSTVLGSPAGLPDLGGIDFDDAVLAYVLGSAGPQTPGFDADDPHVVTAMARLRRECVDAKEGLSADTAVTIPVLLGGASTSVRLTRREFETMIAGAVEETFASLDAALDSAGMAPHELRRVLFTGGSSRIPLITQLLSARYPGVQVERDIDPKLAVPIGAVLALGLPTVGARHAARPRPAAEWATGNPAPVPLVVGMAAPERPPLERDGFERDLDHDAGVPLVQPRRRRKSPLVLYVAAGVLMFGGYGLSTLHPMDSGNALPAGTLQEKQVGGAKHAKAEERAPEESAAEKSKSAESTTTAADSGSTAGGRQEGSADPRAAKSETATTDESTADEASGRTVATGAKSVRVEGRAKNGSQRAAGGATDSASGRTAQTGADTPQADQSMGAVPADSTATAEGAGVQAPAEVEDTSMDSGTVEAFNDGSPGAPAPPDGP